MLVIGGSGFIGTELLKELVALSSCEVTLIIHKKKPSLVIPDHWKVIYGGFESQDWNKILAPSFDVIFHLARISGNVFGVAGRLVSARKAKRANIALLKNLVSSHPKTKLVFASNSLMLGGNGKLTCDEQDLIRPAAFAKQFKLAEQPFLQQANMKENVIVLHFPWVLGKGGWFDTVYLQRIEKRKKIPIYHSEDQEMSFISVYDAAKALIYYAEYAEAGRYCVYQPDSVKAESWYNKLKSTFKVDKENLMNVGLKKPFNKAMKDAFKLNPALNTNFPDLLNGVPFTYKSCEAMLDAALGSSAGKRISNK